MNGVVGRLCLDHPFLGAFRCTHLTAWWAHGKGVESAPSVRGSPFMMHVRGRMSASQMRRYDNQLAEVVLYSSRYGHEIAEAESQCAEVQACRVLEHGANNTVLGLQTLHDRILHGSGAHDGVEKNRRCVLGLVDLIEHTQESVERSCMQVHPSVRPARICSVGLRRQEGWAL